jgi:amino acid adenylation domain-containing protein
MQEEASCFVIDALWSAAQRHAARPMLTAGPVTLGYREAWDRARRAAAAIGEMTAQDKLVGFFCNRDETAYLAILAILASGRGYIPLNPKLPDERLRHIMRAADLGVVVIGKSVETRARTLLEGFDGPVAAICLASDGGALAGVPGLRLRTAADVAALAPAEAQRPASPDDPAYLLFTSGSTGEPKGVPVSNRNLSAYVHYIRGLYSFGPQDVHSQTFELTFDLSAHDMMSAFTTGGSLVRFAEAELISPARILRKHNVTSWFSVPSLGSLMAQTGALKPASLPSLRVSLFCGEALPQALAARWQEAAPQSIVENLYGPTEATIAITRYRWDAAISADECRHGLVPIGRAFDGQETALIDDNGRKITGVGSGMLLLSGSQVAGGYWKAPEQTAEKFVRLQDSGDQLWYVTGDIAEIDATGCLHFIGRSDNQIKFRGYRIELPEIEAALRKAAGADMVVALPWPMEGSEIKGITAVLAGPGGGEQALAAALRRILPDYMVPQRVRYFAELPRNLSGKIDRNAIRALLDQTGD